MSSLSTGLAADRGEVLFDGRPVDLALCSRFGYMPEERGLYPKMRARDQLIYLARLHGVPAGEAERAADRWIERLGVAERAASNLASLVLLDAFIPLDGETMADHVGSRGDEYRAAAADDPGWLAPAPPAAVLGVADEDQAWVDGLMTPHPVQTYLQPISLTGGVDGIEDRVYIACTSPGLPTLEESRRRIAAVGMPTAELECGHDAMIAKPAELTRILLGSA